MRLILTLLEWGSGEGTEEEQLEFSPSSSFPFSLHHHHQLHEGQKKGNLECEHSAVDAEPVSVVGFLSLSRRGA